MLGKGQKCVFHSQWIWIRKSNTCQHITAIHSSSVWILFHLNPSWDNQSFILYLKYYYICWFIFYFNIYDIFCTYLLRSMIFFLNHHSYFFFYFMFACLEINIPTFFLMTRKVTMTMTTMNAVHTSPSVYGRWFSVSDETLVSADSSVSHSFSNSILYR